jgi:hypothetical protein
MIQYTYATQFGLENPTYQNVPSWAIVQQYPRVLGVELGKLPDCTPNLNAVNGSRAMYGMGHFSNAFEPMLTQIQQIIEFEVERKRQDPSYDQGLLTKLFNEFQVSLNQVMSRHPNAFFAQNGQQYLNPMPGSEPAWAELIRVVLDHPVMEGVLDRYPQVEQFHQQMLQASGLNIGGILAILALSAATIVGGVYAYKWLSRTTEPMMLPMPTSPMMPSTSSLLPPMSRPM